MMMRIAALMIFCMTLAAPAEARRNGAYHHVVRSYHYRHYRRVHQYRHRNIHQDHSNQERRHVEVEIERVTDAQIMEPQLPIVFQYAVGNAVGEKLSGGFPWTDERSCQ
jgi:hypothetical protein